MFQLKNETQLVLAILVKNFWKNTTNNKGIIWLIKIIFSEVTEMKCKAA